MTGGNGTLVLGAGSWGTALAVAACRADAGPVYLWGRNAQAMNAMRDQRTNSVYLPGVVLPDELNFVSDISSVPRNVDVVVAAVPLQTLRSVLEQLRDIRDLPRCVACASKGLESETLLRADQIVASVFPDGVDFAMLSGPNFAIEVAENRPAAITVGAANARAGQELVRRFHSTTFRPYYSDDVIAVEIGGALKNVIAIAAGISDGLNLGANSRAALITRGLAEIARFGVAEGGRMETFMGLSGLGDLVLTCTDDKSRNRRFGLRIAAGETVSAAIEQIGLVEGAVTALALAEAAERSGIDMPICQEVAATIQGITTPEKAVRNLLSRSPVDEAGGLATS